MRHLFSMTAPFIFFGIAFASYLTPLHASPWVGQRWDTYAKLSFSYSQQTAYWDSKGMIQSSPKFSSYDVSLYTDIALSDKLAATISLPLSGRSVSPASLVWRGADAIFSMRYQWLDRVGLPAMSFELPLSIPLSDGTLHPLHTSRTTAVTPTLHIGTGFVAGGFNHYSRADLGYRYPLFFGPDRNKGRVKSALVYSIEWGVSLNEKLMPKLRLSGQRALKEVEGSADPFGDTPAYQHFIQAEAGLLFWLNKTMGLDGSIRAPFSGENFGKGLSYSLGIFMNF